MTQPKPCPHCGKIPLSPTASLIIRHHKKGLRSYQIAAKLHISQALVAVTLRTHSLRANPNPWSNPSNAPPHRLARKINN